MQTLAATQDPGTITVRPLRESDLGAADHIMRTAFGTYLGVPDPTKWGVYNSKGHAGQGLRSPSQLAVDGSQLVISGTPDGTTRGYERQVRPTEVRPLGGAHRPSCR